MPSAKNSFLNTFYAAPIDIGAVYLKILKVLCKIEPHEISKDNNTIFVNIILSEIFKLHTLDIFRYNLQDSKNFFVYLY